MPQEWVRGCLGWVVLLEWVAVVTNPVVADPAILPFTNLRPGLRLRPGLVLVDGNRLPMLDVRAEAIVQGDAKVQAISAASILAKVHRDRLCTQLHEAHPQYGFDVHKGYPTAAHLTALREHGATPAHRRTFGPVKVVLASAADPLAAPLR